MPLTLLAIQHCTTVSCNYELLALCCTANICSAISEGHGDTAMALLKAGAETDKKDVDGHLAIDLAPDSKVRHQCHTYKFRPLMALKIRKYISQSAEREGIDVL